MMGRGRHVESAIEEKRLAPRIEGRALGYPESLNFRERFSGADGFERRRVGEQFFQTLDFQIVGIKALQGRGKHDAEIERTENFAFGDDELHAAAFASGEDARARREADGNHREAGQRGGTDRGSKRAVVANGGRYTPIESPKRPLNQTPKSVND